MAEPNELSPAELEDPQIHEALQSEKIAGNLAAEARLTWQKAQEANSALCKDRGFGAVSSQEGQARKGGLNFELRCQELNASNKPFCPYAAS